ncbi:YqiA/YcfP family alpha/beta fold hydrolase [Candidatus Thiosymbion oneisti]|uniref:YqiA/YcfP family alpha/beta fold hydrolase n=1 Tax=Candidatus Thiosymbion oneisti TaxID=589554 RepID=UPI000B7FC849|nr:YqiA/YcfP family alpha/beta fold hydrolase [Candidatus Thiosymbion oneisti]
MLIYLHGLNSSNQSHKAGVLHERLAPSRVLVPSYPAHRPDAAIAKLSDFFRGLREEQPPIVVGSSMGGFYAQYLARQFTFAHLFLINPALTPWDLLRGFEGTSQTTAYGETYIIGRDLIESTRKYGVDTPCDGVPTTLFLDQGDEVIDFRIAESLYRDCGRLLIFKGGDHEFQHLEEATAVIREAVIREEAARD